MFKYLKYLRYLGLFPFVVKDDTIKFDKISASFSLLFFIILCFNTVVTYITFDSSSFKLTSLQDFLSRYGSLLNLIIIGVHLITLTIYKETFCSYFRFLSKLKKYFEASSKEQTRKLAFLLLVNWFSSIMGCVLLYIKPITPNTWFNLIAINSTILVLLTTSCISFIGYIINIINIVLTELITKLNVFICSEIYLEKLLHYYKKICILSKYLDQFFGLSFLFISVLIFIINVSNLFILISARYAKILFVYMGINNIILTTVVIAFYQLIIICETCEMKVRLK